MQCGRLHNPIMLKLIFITKLMKTSVDNWNDGKTHPNLRNTVCFGMVQTGYFITSP